MNDTIKILDNSDFSVQKDATSTAKQVVKDAPSTEILESLYADEELFNWMRAADLK